MEEKAKNLAKSTAAIIIFSLLGKFLGLGREALIASQYGSGMEKAAWTVAQSSTGLMSALITEAIATTFIPQLQKVHLNEPPEAKDRFTSNMISVSMVVAIIVALLGIIFAPFIANITGGGFDPETKNLTISLIRYSMPLIIFAATVGIFTGYLQFNNRFAAAGAVNLPYNAIYILYLVFLVPSFGIKGLAIFSILAVLGQVLFLIPSVLKEDFHFKPVLDFKDPYTHQALLLSLPVLVSVSINNINTIFNKYLATGLGNAAVSRLDYANKINLVILGIFITAITSVVFPAMSRAFAEKNQLLGKQIMNGAVKAILLITVPSAIGMAVLSRPIIEIALQYGAFTPEDTIETAKVLVFYSPVLVFLSINNALNRVFFSIQDTKTPFYIGICNVVINITLNLLVVKTLGVKGLAGSVSVATAVACLLRFIILRKRIGHLGISSYIRAIIKTCLAGLIMGIFASVAFFPLEALLMGFLAGVKLRLAKLLLLLIVVLCSAFLYGLILYLLGFREVRDLVHLLQTRMEKRKERKALNKK